MTLILTESFEYDPPTSYKWNTTQPVTVSGSGNFRTGARGMTHSATGGTRVFTAAEEHATFIVGMALKLNSLAVAVDPIVFRSDSNATTHLTVGTTTAGTLQVWLGPVSTGTLLGTSAAVLLAGVWQYIEVKATLHDSAGAVEVRVDGTQVLSLTGIDTKNAGTKAVFDSVSVRPGNLSGNRGDDVYVCNGAGSVNNDFLGTVRIEMLKPNGNGASSGWTGSDGDSTDNYLLVDDTIPTMSMVDYVDAASAGLKDTYAFENSAEPAANAVRGVMVHAYGQKSDAGARGVDMVARTSGGTEATAAGQALVNGVARLLYAAFETKPGGGTWTVSDVNGAEFGVSAT